MVHPAGNLPGQVVRTEEHLPVRFLLYFTPQQAKQLSLYAKVAFFYFMCGAVALYKVYNCQSDDSNPERCIHLVNRVKVGGTVLFGVSVLFCVLIGKIFMQSRIPERART